MSSIGPFELIVVLVIALLVLGPKRLPELGRSLGTGMREFKDAILGSPRTGAPPAIASSPSEQSDDAPGRSRG
ncbi:MAG TPA: twin-arginine translocase TatA/TatE family subunit [Solirubrobacteraceae bacterium]|jgi:sec-independent protein translocase protein TatA